MIWLCLILLALLVVHLQKTSAQRALDRLRYSFHADEILAEPEQVLTGEIVLENKSRLPVLYLRMVTRLPEGAKVYGEARWLEQTVFQRPNHLAVEQSAYLLPRRRRICRLQFSLPERGRYQLGSGTVFAGDFLGIRERNREEEAQWEVVVIPRRAAEPDVLRTLGGFLGDISVRRFIHEDPVLTVGFREYTGREPMKSIAWTQTARAGRMMVRQYDYTTDWNVMVLLNLEGGTREQIEQCFRITRTVCETLEQRGIPFSFATNGDLMSHMGLVSRVAEGLGRQHLHTVLYGLGRSHCLCRYSWQQLAEEVRRSGRTGRSYILITPPMPEASLAAAERLKKQGGLCLLVGQEVTP